MSNDLTRLAAATLTDWINRGQLYDAVFRKQGKYGYTPYLDLVTSKMMDGAANTKEFSAQIQTGRNTNFQYYSGYETWNTRPIKGYERAYFGSHQSVISWSACAEELYYNGSGNTKLFDIMKNIKDTTVKSIKDELNVRLLNRNHPLVTGNPGGAPTEFFSDLSVIIGDEKSAVRVYGGKDAAEAPYWRSLIKRPGEKLPKDWQSLDEADWVRDSDSNVISGGTYAGWQTLKLDDLSEMIEMLSDVYASGYVALTTRDIMLNLERKLRAESITVNNQLNGVLKAFNYTGINYRGVDFVRDKAVPEGTIYFLHPEALKFRPIAGRWMVMRDEITPHNQDAVYGSIFAWGEQYSADRHALGAFYRVRD